MPGLEGAIGIAGAHRIRPRRTPPAHHLGDHLAPYGGLVAEQYEGGRPIRRRRGRHPLEPRPKAQRQSVGRPVRRHDDGARVLAEACFRPCGVAHDEEHRAEDAVARARRGGIEHVRQHGASPERRQQLVAAEPRGLASSEDDRENRGNGGHASKR